MGGGGDAYSSRIRGVRGRAPMPTAASKPPPPPLPLSLLSLSLSLSLSFTTSIFSRILSPSNCSIICSMVLSFHSCISFLRKAVDSLGSRLLCSFARQKIVKARRVVLRDEAWPTEACATTLSRHWSSLSLSLSLILSFEKKELWRINRVLFGSSSVLWRQATLRDEMCSTKARTWKSVHGRRRRGRFRCTK